MLNDTTNDDSNNELLFITCYNEFVKASYPEKLESIVVWGGLSANCGEEQLSRLVDSNCLTLKRMVFLPRQTKGGVLIRPKYYRGNRAGRTEFPALKFMAINYLIVRGPRQQGPYFWGWDTPSLTDLTIVSCETEFIEKYHRKVPESVESAKFLFRTLRRNTPSLERIYFRERSIDFNKGDEEWQPLTMGATNLSSDRYTILSLQGPLGAKWSHIRVILAARGEREENCLIAKLPYSILQEITTYMGSGFCVF